MHICSNSNEYVYLQVVYISCMSGVGGGGGFAEVLDGGESALR